MSRCAHRSTSYVRIDPESHVFDRISLSPTPSIMSTSTDDSHECNSGCLAATLECFQDDHPSCTDDLQVCPCPSSSQQVSHCQRNTENEKDKDNGNSSQTRVEESQRRASHSQTREKSREKSRGRSRGGSRGRSRCRSRGISRSKSRGRRSRSRGDRHMKKHGYCQKHSHEHGCKNKLANMLKHRLMMSGHFHKKIGQGHHGHGHGHGHSLFGHHGHNFHHMMKRGHPHHHHFHHGMKPMPRTFKERPKNIEQCRSFRRVRQLGRPSHQIDEIFRRILRGFHTVA